jgi:hypothetical protein
MPGDAHTDEFIKPNGRLQMQFMLDKQVPLPDKLRNGHTRAFETLVALDSWLHEVFYHGELQERHYLRHDRTLPTTPHANYFNVQSTYRKAANRVLVNAAKLMNLPISKDDIVNDIQMPGFGR